ncbi:hypothetical protein VHEMI09439 [[Torrubiella] hemipterigena]|uniref:NF-kappa-B inhibitor-like protein 1 n=1 Tax=[Torrubiella] hemipterigena TaxID=1531966 RepID=A0A0A1T9W5_9HYPO|nr:hypothetical protein VHEMI09439 [[Torrubiella] hemipterigena]
MSAEPPASPKRRHILSSINPETSRRTSPERKHGRRRRVSRSPPDIDQDAPIADSAAQSHRDHPTKDDHSVKDDLSRPRRTRIRLKSDKRQRRSRSRSRDKHSSSSRRHGHSSRRHRRRSRSPTPPNPHEAAPLDPEEAFRQSLFDAMADDEGAAYWEGVYGQPIHVYNDQKVGPEGELERMTDEEYASHVRQKMWEKTHAGLLEERARRDAEKKKREEEKQRNRKLQEDMERSLRRGEERRARRSWERRWGEYAKAWANWDGSASTLAWPLENGRGQGDIRPEDVHAFFVHGLGLDALGYAAFVAKLKDERVRWHPDKMQQRLGGKVDDDIMKDVTAIFQTIDMLWTEMRDKAT